MDTFLKIICDLSFKYVKRIKLDFACGKHSNKMFQSECATAYDCKYMYNEIKSN